MYIHNMSLLYQIHIMKKRQTNNNKKDQKWLFKIKDSELICYSIRFITFFKFPFIIYKVSLSFSKFIKEFSMRYVQNRKIRLFLNQKGSFKS